MCFAILVRDRKIDKFSLEYLNKFLKNNNKKLVGCKHGNVMNKNKNKNYIKGHARRRIANFVVTENLKKTSLIFVVVI